MVTTGAIRRVKLQSNLHHRQTNTQLFTGRMHFLSPNQQRRSTEGKCICRESFIIVVIAGRAAEGDGWLLRHGWLVSDCQLHSRTVRAALPASVGEVSWPAARQRTVDERGLAVVSELLNPAAVVCPLLRKYSRLFENQQKSLALNSVLFS